MPRENVRALVAPGDVCGSSTVDEVVAKASHDESLTRAAMQNVVARLAVHRRAAVWRAEVIIAIAALHERLLWHVSVGAAGYEDIVSILAKDVAFSGDFI